MTREEMMTCVKKRIPGVVALCCLAVMAFELPTAAQTCSGDCDANGAVAVNEMILAVNILLGITDLSVCAAADADDNGIVAVNEVIGSVGHGLCGCAGCPTPAPVSPTPSRTPTQTLLPATATPTVEIPSDEIAAACDHNCRLARSCDPEEFDMQEGSIEQCTEFCVGDFDDEPIGCIEGTLGYFDCVNRRNACGLPSACSNAFVAAAQSCPGLQFPGPPSVFY